MTVPFAGRMMLGPMCPTRNNEIFRLQTMSQNMLGTK